MTVSALFDNNNSAVFWSWTATATEQRLGFRAFTNAPASTSMCRPIKNRATNMAPLRRAVLLALAGRWELVCICRIIGTFLVFRGIRCGVSAPCARCSCLHSIFNIWTIALAVPGWLKCCVSKQASLPGKPEIFIGRTHIDSSSYFGGGREHCSDKDLIVLSEKMNRFFALQQPCTLGFNYSKKARFPYRRNAILVFMKSWIGLHQRRITVKKGRYCAGCACDSRQGHCAATPCIQCLARGFTRTARWNGPVHTLLGRRFSCRIA